MQVLQFLTNVTNRLFYYVAIGCTEQSSVFFAFEKMIDIARLHNNISKPFHRYLWKYRNISKKSRFTEKTKVAILIKTILALKKQYFLN